ncbi:uncharacterized protein LOC142225012 [Haematobia irritans]|uniref:uncharacterized protein LOC142225012 n=1 Tax=Haematobia irritans TaxID=7368 RepID=UPI003F503925
MYIQPMMRRAWNQHSNQVYLNNKESILSSIYPEKCLLIKHVLKDISLDNFELFLWCDSSIALGWLGKPPHTWKTFVANRIAKIIRNVGNCSWRHIRSNENPADLGSRGCSPMELMNSSLWWHGPEWLIEPPENWPKSVVSIENPPEIRKIETFHLSGNDEDILDRFSCWARALRVISYVLRFSKSSRRQVVSTSLSITHQEFKETRNLLIRVTQKKYYSQEYDNMTMSKQVNRKSSLYTINPYIDPSGIIRVNGRIANSNLRFSERHPIIIPVKSQYCKLLISYLHTTLLHAEINLLMRSVREEYYISRLSTKAIHLELCSNLSSESFLAAFTRFAARRGLPSKIMSDNGTNFVGAERKLRHEFKEFLNTTSRDIAEKYEIHGFEWSFIPPNAPHMGGIWEAGVKSFKIHFRKVSQNHKYTFEEFTTLLARIEAVLNSRPLSPMTDDPFEILALTPGHFLRGAPLVAAPETVSDNLSYVDRWDKLKSQQHEFAHRWKDEYLKELQQ